MAEEKKEEKRKNGSISLKQGRATIMWQDREQPFGIFFVTGQVRAALRKSRQGFYAERIRAICRELEAGGLFAIPKAKARLEALQAGRDINRQFLKMICGWLGNLWMFRNVKTGGGGKSPDELYRENMEKIFQKAA